MLHANNHLLAFIKKIPFYVSLTDLHNEENREIKRKNHSFISITKM